MAFFRQNLTSKHWLQAKILAVGTLLGLVLLTASPAVWAQTLDLPQNIAGEGKTLEVPVLKLDGIQNNQELITALYDKQETKGLVFNIIRIAKYILGGIFMLFLATYAVNLITSGGNDEKVTEFKNSMIYALIGFVVLALADPISTAFNFAETDKNFITNFESLKQSVELGGYSLRAAAKLIQYILGGMALLYMGVAGFRILTSDGNEETIKTSRKTMVWAAFGLMLATIVTPLVDLIFAPTAAGSIIIDVDPNLSPELQHQFLLEIGRLATRGAILNQVKFFQTFVAATATLMLFLAGFKLVTAGGNEEVVTKQHKTISWIFLGMGTILVAEAFVTVFAPEVDGQVVAPGMEQIGTFSQQMGGFTNFLLTFTGGLAVLALVVGALYFSTAAMNAEQAEKGKKIILGAVLGLVLTISAYAVVNTILSGYAEPPALSISVGR